MTAQGGGPPRTALVGGTVIDVRRGTTIPDAAVLVESGRISTVGPRAQVPVDGARTIDTKGAWLIPGLMDMHVHVSGEGRSDLLPLYVAHGVTTVRDVGGSLTVLRLLRDDLETGRLVGPRLFYAGPLLDGIPPLWPPMTMLVDTEARAESAVRFLATHEVSVVKVYNSVSEASLAVVIRTAHELGLPVTGHVPRAVRTSRAVEMGMDGLEHIRVTGREILPAAEADKIDYLPLRRREPLLWERYDPTSAQCAELAERFARSRLFLDPTLVVDASVSFPEDTSTNPAELPAWIAEMLTQSQRPPEIRAVPEDLRELGSSGFAKRLQFIGVCARAGVRLIAGTDLTGVGEQLPGRGLQRELAYFVDAGLSPLQALQAATITPAEALGKERELGAIEPGFHADLVILDADPLADIRNLRRVRAVMQRGTLATPAELLREPQSKAGGSR